MNDKPDDVDKTDDGLADAEHTEATGAAADAADELVVADDASVSLDKSSASDDESVDETDLPDSAAPVAAGSARAAARRSVRAGVTEGKGRATRARDAEVEKPNIFARILRFLKEVIAELGKVIWPARNQMVTYTIVVIVFVVFMVALVSGLDVLFARVMLAVFG